MFAVSAKSCSLSVPCSYNPLCHASMQGRAMPCKQHGPPPISLQAPCKYFHLPYREVGAGGSICFQTSHEISKPVFHIHQDLALALCQLEGINLFKEKKRLSLGLVPCSPWELANQAGKMLTLPALKLPWILSFPNLLPKQNMDFMLLIPSVLEKKLPLGHEVDRPPEWATQFSLCVGCNFPFDIFFLSINGLFVKTFISAGNICIGHK